MSIALHRQGRMSEIQRRRQSETECSSPLASSSSSLSSSSIGNNSDCEEEEKEVQSAYRGGGGRSLDLGALEQNLPHPDLPKGGLSKCYAGKAKSFSDLGKAESIANISEIEKKEHALNKRRRNHIALKHRPITSCRSALSLAATAMEGGGAGLTIQDSNSASSTDFRYHHHDHRHSQQHHSNSYLPPMYPGSMTHQKLASLPSPTPLRSFSMADLHYFSAAAAASTN